MAKTTAIEWADAMLLAYLAGCIDCDGSISISRVKNYKPKDRGRAVCYFVATIRCNQITPDIPRILFETFSGHLKRYEHKKWKRPLYTWQVTNKKAAVVAGALLPYLRLKKGSAKLILEFDESMKKTRGGGVRLTDEIFRERERLYLEATSLTQPRNKRAAMPVEASFLESA